MYRTLPNSRKEDVDIIQQAVARYYEIEPTLLLIPTRGAARISNARQVAMCLSYELTGCTLVEIGDRFGGRHHTTVIHAREEVYDRIRWDEPFQKQISEIKEQVISERK